MTQSPKLGAIAVVIRDDHILLVQRSKPPSQGLWGCPGGHVELGETALQAAQRELLEETGVVATARDYLTNVDVIRHHPNGAVEVHYLLAAVLCDYVSGEPIAMDDAADAKWWPIETVLAGGPQFSPNVAQVLGTALRGKG